MRVAQKHQVAWGFQRVRYSSPKRKSCTNFIKLRIFALDNGGRWKGMKTFIALQCILLQLSIVGCTPLKVN